MGASSKSNKFQTRQQVEDETSGNEAYVFTRATGAVENRTRLTHWCCNNRLRSFEETPSDGTF
jgi:hypothetical protein